jgi:AraC-like DNA-binding protein
MNRREEIISKLINYLEDHLTENFKLDELAEKAGYSKYHLNRIFAEVVGCTIGRYIMRRRLTEAARLLLSTKQPIIDIAMQVGYESQQAFTFAFKQLYEESPQVYRSHGIFYPKQLRFVYNCKTDVYRVNQIMNISIMNMSSGVRAA